MNLIDNTVTIPMTLGAGYTVDHFTTALAPFLNGTLINLDSTVIPDSITSLRDYQFQNFSSLVTVDLNNVSNIGASTFLDCAIQELNLPNLTSAGTYAFGYNPFTEVELPNLIEIASNMFRGCQNLKTADFLSVMAIDANAFYQCENLDTLILRSTSIVELNGARQFYETKIEDGEGYIYVPDDLVETYQESSAWLQYASQIHSIEEL